MGAFAVGGRAVGNHARHLAADRQAEACVRSAASDELLDVASAPADEIVTRSVAAMRARGAVTETFSDADGRPLFARTVSGDKLSLPAGGDWRIDGTAPAERPPACCPG